MEGSISHRVQCKQHGQAPFSKNTVSKLANLWPAILLFDSPPPNYFTHFLITSLVKYFEANSRYVNSSVNICTIFLKKIKKILNCHTIIILKIILGLGLVVQTCKPSHIGWLRPLRLAGIKLAAAVEGFQVQAWVLRLCLQMKSNKTIDTA